MKHARQARKCRPRRRSSRRANVKGHSDRCGPFYTSVILRSKATKNIYGVHLPLPQEAFSQETFHCIVATDVTRILRCAQNDGGYFVVLLVDEVDGVLAAVEVEVLLDDEDESDEALELELLLPDFAPPFDEP